MARLQGSRRRTWMTVLAAVLAIALYGAGLLSGLYVSKSVEERQQADVSFLVEYVDSLENDLRGFQIQEQFLNSLSDEESCAFSQVYFSQVAENLNFYWRVLPSRLEEYERGRELDEAYLQLKEQYTTASLHGWLISRDNQNKCGDDTIVPILYLYSRDCEECVAQGEALDEVKGRMQERNVTVVTFTIDTDAQDAALSLIKKYYGIESTPALVVDEQVLQGQVYPAGDVLEALA